MVVGIPHPSHSFTETHPVVYETTRAARRKKTLWGMKLWQMKNQCLQHEGVDCLSHHMRAFMWEIKRPLSSQLCYLEENPIGNLGNPLETFKIPHTHTTCKISSLIIKRGLELMVDTLGYTFHMEDVGIRPPPLVEFTSSTSPFNERLNLKIFYPRFVSGWRWIFDPM